MKNLSPILQTALTVVAVIVVINIVKPMLPAALSKWL